MKTLKNTGSLLLTIILCSLYGCIITGCRGDP